jgi:hypothetical protein
LSRQIVKLKRGGKPGILHCRGLPRLIGKPLRLDLPKAANGDVQGAALLLKVDLRRLG